jgi:hypothetical protein
VTALARHVVWLVALSLALVSVRAHAESTKVLCIQANTDAQSLRREGKLAEAREKLRTCSEAKCPALVSADCVKRLDELENAQPTVIFDVFDASGHEVNDVSVSIDGQRVLDRLEGTSVPVDLGEHVVTFAAEGRPTVTQKLTFREGEKSRHVRITIGNAPGTATAAGAAATTEPGTPEQPSGSTSGPVESVPPAGSESSGHSQRTVGYVVGGVGLAGLAVGGMFGLFAISAKHRQIDYCPSATNCPHYETASAEHQYAQTYGLVSTISFVVGGAATATGLVLVLTAKPTHRNALVLAPNVVARGGGLELSGAW